MWNRDIGLGVNPTKNALVPFRIGRKLEGNNPPAATT